MTNNPLMAYKPAERVFVKLPSKGMFYEDGVINLDDEEVGVLPMSAKDEMLFKNPDALMNGRAVKQVIENCVPSVINANKLTVADTEALLLAVKLATNEQSYDVSTKCPNCKKEGVFERDIDLLLLTLTHNNNEYTYVVDDDVTIYLKPNTWSSHSKLQQIAFKQQRMIQVAQNPNLSDTEKQEMFNEVFNHMISLNVDLISDSILRIVVPEGAVTDNAFIREYVEILSKTQLSELSDIVEGINEVGVSHSMDVMCPHCEHEWELKDLKFDPSYFFE